MKEHSFIIVVILVVFFVGTIAFLSLVQPRTARAPHTAMPVDMESKDMTNMEQDNETLDANFDTDFQNLDAELNGI